MTAGQTTSRNLTWKILIPIIVILAIVVGGLTFLRSQLQGHPSSAHHAEVAVGSVLDDFELHPLSGETLHLSQIPGKLHLVNFWATWCEACMIEMPSIVKLRQEYYKKGFEVVGVNVDENPGAILPPVLKKYGIEFPIFTDAESGDLSDLFDVHAIPLSVVIDHSRKVLWIENGENDWFSKPFRAKVEEWLKAP